MLRGYRRYFVAAVVGLALVGSAQAKETDSAKAQQPSAQKVGNVAQPALPPLIRTLSADDPDPNCGSYKYQSNADLCAQWKAADAAYSAARAAWILGALGILVSGFTLFFAARAAHWAKQAALHTEQGAKAADLAVIETAKATESNLRPSN
jgi:hypothetical protein